jgi:glycosyltransferase involved in cell wall biosynthesis
VRVVHVSEVGSGGVRGLLADYSADQLARGFDVHIVGGLPLAGIPGQFHEWHGNRHRPVRAALDALRLQRLLDDLSPDVVHLHSFFAGVFGRSYPGKCPYPVVYQPHGWAFDAVTRRSLRAALVRFERWAGRRTDVLATNSSDEIEEARSAGITTPAVPLGVPIDLDWFVPVSQGDRKALRTRLGFDDQVVLLCLGRVARQKGYDILVREWERQPIPGAAVYLVGAGSTRQFKAMAPTQWGRTVHAVGETDDARMWLQAADVLLLPSRYEGQSVAVSEALACGLPVVAFDVNGARAAVVEGGDPAGAVVARGDARAMLAEVARRVSEPFLRETEAIVARGRAERDSAPEQILDRLVDTYVSAIDARRT